MLPWIAAVLFGALAPTLIVSSVSADVRILPLAFAVTLGHSVMLGLPVALFFRAKRWTRLRAVLVGAFLIGAIPFGILSLPFGGAASVNGIPTIVNGFPTLAGWLSYMRSLAIAGALGASGGFVFWVTLRYCGVLVASDDEGAATMPGERRMAAALTAAATIASVAVAAIPSVTMDRSCHNMFRDGRRSISASLNIDLDIAMVDWPAVTKVLEDFGVSHGMSFRDSSSNRPQVKVLGLSACTEQVVITAIDQRWDLRNYEPLVAGRGVPVGIYDLTDGNAWQLLARELVAKLDSQWPGKVRFRDGGGRLIPPPASLLMP
jgi:hypothetical protein